MVLILVGICLIIKLYSANSYRVETGYSSVFFPSFAASLRAVLGNFDTSAGDILYGMLVALLIFKATSWLIQRFRNRKVKSSKILWRNMLYNSLLFACTVYILFNVFWGINYNRKGIAWQLQLPALTYTSEELKELNCLLLVKINNSKLSLINSKRAYPSNKDLFRGVSDAFKQAGENHSFLQYKNPCIKKSLWGWFGNYAGFTGYYNPFTGEAQVNTTVPGFIQPFTSCHEVAHQLGYAK
ncbi:MAG: DUF3810 family protein, partial [Gloeobacteraceae cyanobacterium ES-bin-316]|nr:DUF3810 family protein [Ferruginibacter sp.]